METTRRKLWSGWKPRPALLERTLSWLEERQGALSGEVERISATVEQSRREAELAEKLAAAERELAELKAAAAQNVLNPLRRTMPAATAEMLAKHGIGEGPVDVRDPRCGAGRPEPGAAHRGEDASCCAPARSRKSSFQLTAISCQLSAD